MINLFSPEQRRAVKMLYLGRLAIVGLFLFAGAWTAGALLLIPTYLLVRVQAGTFAQEEQLLEEQLKSEGGISPQELLAQTEEKRHLLDAYASSVSIAPIIASIVHARGSGIYLDSFMYETKDGIPTIALRGRADERDALVAFSRTLEAVPAISSVELPVSNLASSVDIEFTMRIALAEEPKTP